MENILLPDGLVRPLSFYLALEEYIAAAYGCGFFVWQVEPTVIIGRNQDLETEVNLDFCRKHGVRVVRRKSGGGCVYADMGNLMVSYITPERGVDIVFPRFLRKMAECLGGFGLEAVVSGHNDILMGGRKVSGSAFFAHTAASIVHCTLMHSVNLDMLQNAITPTEAKLAKHSVKSVRQRVANLSDLIPGIEIEAVKAALTEAFCDSVRMLSPAEIEAVKDLEMRSKSLIFDTTMDQSLKTTCLHEDHIALGAKMSPFAGFDMPIQYSGIIQEHNAVRNAVGMFDVSHMGEIFVDGPDAEAFVNHIFTNDVKGLGPGAILYGMMCYPDGGTVDDLLVYKEFESGFLLVVNAANVDKDYKWLLEQSKDYKVEIFDDSESWGQIALQGPAAEDALVKLFGIEELRELEFYTFYDLEDEDGGRVIVSRTGYTGEDGFEIYASPDNIRDMWAAFIEDGVTPCGLGCRDTLRFEAGLPLYGDELSSEISPVMAGLSMFCKFDKPEFIGKDALLKQKTEGVERKIVGIELKDNAIPRAGYPVELEDGTQVGVVTTGYHSITLDKSICFALVDAAYAALGTPLWIRIRKHVFPGEVVKKRFYKTNYKK